MVTVNHPYGGNDSCRPFQHVHRHTAPLELSFVAPAAFEMIQCICKYTGLFILAKSLGGQRSLTNYPTVKTQPLVSVKRCEQLIINGVLVRLSGDRGYGGSADGPTNAIIVADFSGFGY